MRRAIGAAILSALVMAACATDQEPVGTAAPAADAVTTTTGRSSTTSPTAITIRPEDPSETTATTTLSALQSLRYETVLDSLPFPIFLTALPGSGVTWIATKDGQIWTMSNGVLASEPLVDLSAQSANDGERGFLGMALDPERHDVIYVHYSANDGDTVVSELTLDQGSFEERVLLRLDQPASNHNGGMLQFGPDGALYVGLGDGGGANDRYGNGQNTETLLGGIVRIDPSGGDPELWSYGLRNPWRFWFDGEMLYIADVGQNTYEEVDVVGFDTAGYNFGWPITEALHCFSPSRGCDTDGLTLPVLEVQHGDAGTCSITGGVVYRGTEIPELEGHYLYSDYCGGWLRSFRWDGTGIVDQTDWTDDVGSPGSVVSFGVDGEGEVYVLTPGAVLRLTAER